MPNISTQPNRFYPSIPEISEDTTSHTLALQTIKDALQTHERRDSNYLKSFIRFEELVDLGIIDANGEFILELGGSGEDGATELNELTDVTISGLADNKILGYDSTSTQWVPQTAAELNLSEIGHTHPPNVGDLNDLGDVDLSGAADYDLLFRTGSIWEATKGLLQWNGADLHIASGDLRFYAVGDAVTSALRQNFPAGGDLGVQVPSGDFVIQTGQAVRVQPGTDFYVQNANLYMNISEGVRWTHGAGSNEFLGFEEVGQASTPTNFVVHETFIDSFTTSQTYVDTDNGLDQAQNVFGDGDEILIVHQALLYNNSNSGADSNGYQIIADGVVLDGSEQLGEGLGATRPREAANPYGYVGFFTADIAGANVKTQLKRGSGGTEYVCSAEGGFMLNLTHSVPNHVKDSSLAGTDVSKFGTGTGLTWVLTDTAVTLEAGSYILYIGARYDNMGGAAATPTGGFNDGTTDLELFGRTLEDSATDQMSFGGTYYLEDYAGGTVTVIGRANNIITGCIMDYVCIVAIPLSDFANSWAVQQDDTELFLAAEDTDEVINTINIASIPTTANYLALAWGQYEYAGTQLSTCSEILENVDSGGDTLIGWDNLYTLRKTTALTGDQQNINSSVRTYTAGEQVDIKQNAINYNVGFGTQSHKNHGLALLEMNTVESLGGTLYVGDPGFITHIDGTLIEFENTIGLNWANAAGLNIELVVLNDVVDPFDDTTTDSIPFTGTDTDTTYTSPGGNVFTFFANAEISTDQFFDAPSSLYLDGASSYVSCANADFLPGTEDFTIEAMVYNLDTFQGPIMGIYTNGTDASWRFWLDTNRQCEVNFYTDVDGINVLEGPVLQVVQDQWQHWCLERVDTVVSLYLDGVLQDSTVITSGASLNDSSGPPTTPMRIGSVGASINYMNGYVDNLRVTIGSVRYGAPFTPPTSFESTAFSEFVLGDPVYKTQIDGSQVNVTTNIDVTGLMEADRIIAGDPGTEGTGITVNGVTYESVLKASDIGGTHAAQFIMHRHSTTLPALIIGARAKDDTENHTAVADNDLLLTVLAAGWDGGDYALSSEIRFEVDGATGIDDMPGQITFMTSTDGTQVPVERMRIRASGNVEMDFDLVIAGLVDGVDVAAHAADTDIHWNDAPNDGENYVRNSLAWTALPPAVTGLGLWRYRTETVTPPASGQLRFDNADISSATEFYLHETNDNGSDVSAFLDLLLTVGSVIYMQDQTDATKYVLIELGTVVDNGAYRTYQIATVLEGSGGEPSQNAKVAIVASSGSFIPAAPVTATTTELEDITDAINTDAAKVAGYLVFNTTTGAPVWAVAAADGSVWNDATGATAHTPV